MTTTLLRQPVIQMPGEGKRISVLKDTLISKATTEDTNGIWSCFELVGPAESGPPFHTHPWDEAFYVLEGEVEFQLATPSGQLQTVQGGPGTFIHLPSQTPHSFRILSEQGRFLVWFTPGKAETFYQELDERGVEHVMEIAEKYQLRLIAKPE